MEEQLDEAAEDVTKAVELVEMMSFSDAERAEMKDRDRRVSELLAPLSETERDEFPWFFREQYPPTLQDGPDHDLWLAREDVIREVRQLLDAMDEGLSREKQKALSDMLPALITRKRALDRLASDRLFARLTPHEQQLIIEDRERAAEDARNDAIELERLGRRSGP